MQRSIEAWRARVLEDTGKDPDGLARELVEGWHVHPLYVESDAARARPSQGGFQVAYDVTPATLAPGLEQALRAGVELVWVEAGVGSDVLELVRASGLPSLVVGGAGPGSVADPLRGDGLEGLALPERGWALLASGRQAHEAGAAAHEELALALGVALDWLRVAERRGLDLERSAGAVLVELGLDADVALGIAKLRAARVVWAKLLRASGVRGELAMRVCGSRRGLSSLDPVLNVLRGAAAAFAGVVGGARIVGVPPFDALGGSSRLAERIARNTPLLLREEARLDAVLDPAAGSHYIEALTDQVARATWQALAGLEARGGAIAAHRSLAYETHAARRRDAMRRRTLKMVGVNRYPSPEPPAAAAETDGARDALEIEELRRRASALRIDRRKIDVAVLGAAEKLGPRLEFVRELLAVGGLAASSERTGARAAVVCAADADYASLGPDAVRSLRASGAAAVLIAGRPGAAESALRAAGATGYLHVGCDVVQALSQILDALEAP